MKVTSDVVSTITKSDEMKAGDVGILLEGVNKGKHLLKTYGELVLLENPIYTWGLKASFSIEKLPKGTKFTLEIE